MPLSKPTRILVAAITALIVTAMPGESRSQSSVLREDWSPHSVQHYLTLREAAKTNDLAELALTSYFAGMAGAFLAANADAGKEGGSKMFCLPGAVLLTPAVLRSLVDSDIPRRERGSEADHDVLMKLPLSVYTSLLLRHMFPCPDSTRQ